ncbi:MAG TPA: hypothetical protein VFM38_13965 [Candidatus Limnocylindrales bacterium]|nr:hypothetical protein [Candidatus Limnocylindrales bacterium]
MAAKATDADESLRRLGGGRWQTRDERFTIEPQSGTWAVVDAEQTDDLGLPLVRGPYPTLTAAKAAIAEARASGRPSSPLKERTPASPPKEAPSRGTGRGKGKATAEPAKSKASEEPEEPDEPEEPEEPEEPRWFRDLDHDQRRRAARLIERLTAAGADDPENVVRRDLVGDVPAVASYAVARAIRELGDDASPADIAETLSEGRDSELGVRWRLVDDKGRPIRLDRSDLGAG